MNKKGRIDIILVLWFLFIGFLCVLTGWYLCVIYDSALERDSPGFRLGSAFFFTNDTLCFFYPDIKIAALIGTNSMDPVFDKGHFLIEIDAHSIDDLQVGDIVAFEYPGIEERYNVSTIVHRVIAIDRANQKVKTKGDNVREDDGWIPFEAVKRVVVGIIY